MKRRKFTKNLLLSTAVISSSPIAGFANPGRENQIKKGIMWGSIGVGETIKEKFKYAKQAGFEGIEPMSHLDREQVLEARDETGMKIPSVCGSLHGRYPLSDPDPSVREKGVDALKHLIEDASVYGADTVLLVPGRVNENVAYDDCWNRSVAEIRKAIPFAARLNITIAIENVWNNFLLSPLEAARYVDQFHSPYVKFYFDCGNFLIYGWPEQWIRILGKRIVKIHIKEYSMKLAHSEGRRAGFRVDLMEGDVNWPAVMKALADIGYNDWAIVEQRGGDTEDGLADLAHRLGKILKS